MKVEVQADAGGPRPPSVSRPGHTGDRCVSLGGWTCRGCSGSRASSSGAVHGSPREGQESRTLENVFYPRPSPSTRSAAQSWLSPRACSRGSPSQPLHRSAGPGSEDLRVPLL